MAKEDQKIRNGHKKGIRLSIVIEKRHTTKLKTIIKEYGWPTISLVGKKASFNAWLLVQHADHDIKFQKKVLKLLQKIDRETHDVDRANIAYLTDRLLIKKKKNQRFGTQFDFNKNGQLVLHPIENKKRVNELREKYDLPPLSESIKAADEFNMKVIKKK